MTQLNYLRTSERKSFKRCPQKWFWQYRLGLVPKEQNMTALSFGTGIHYALEKFYDQRVHVPGSTPGFEDLEFYWDAFCDEDDSMGTIRDVESEEQVSPRELGTMMLKGYYEKYGSDPQWDILAVELPFQVVMDDVIIYCGTLDMAVRDRNTQEIWIVDHKTESRAGSVDPDADDQASAYIALGSQVLRDADRICGDEHVKGVIFSFLVKAKPDTRPKNELGLALNKDGTISKKQPRNLFYRQETTRTFEQVERFYEHLEAEVKIMNMMREDRNLVYKTPTKDCKFDCSFYDLCNMDERKSPGLTSFRNAWYVQSDPYASHRK